jgi:hypothetical protein
MAAIFRDLARLLSRTSHPSGTAAGDVWWRSDLSQAHASDGGTSPLVMGPTGNLPAFRGGGWHALPTYGSASTLTTTPDRAYALPLWPGRSCALPGLVVDVVSSGSGTIRTGLYEDNGALPGALIQDFGTVSSGSSGTKTWSPTGLNLRPVLYWLVVVTTNNIGLRSRNTSDPIIGDTSSAGLSTVRNAYYRDNVTGSLPASFGAITGATAGPAFLVQLT